MKIEHYLAELQSTVSSKANEVLADIALDEDINIYITQVEVEQNIGYGRPRTIMKLELLE